MTPDLRAAIATYTAGVLRARHAYLVSIRTDLTARLEGDPEFYDARIAGWWVWGARRRLGPHRA